jgi:signal transduction histidine kinase
MNYKSKTHKTFIAKTLKKHFISILIFFILINVVGMLSSVVIFMNHAKYINEQIEYNIYEYKEVDRQQICRIAQCKEIHIAGSRKSFQVDNYAKLKEIEYVDVIKYNVLKNIWVSSCLKVMLYEEISNTFYVINVHDIIYDYIILMIVFIPIAMLIFIVPLIKSIIKERESLMVTYAGNEALLANKSMISITENIHHELNTPLEVIDNKTEKIRRIISKYLVREYENWMKYDEENNKRNNLSDYDEYKKSEKREINKALIQLEDDFAFIRTSSEQIYNILEKMKGFKHLRYSNGNKSIKNIIDGGFKIIAISNSNFDYNVDEKLDNYSLDNNRIKNADLLNIMLNHIKNSLEANASKIYILFKEENKNFVKLRIIDNGVGIPAEARADIFKPNFSTKGFDDGIRGNGMYLNRHIIEQSGGTIDLVNTSHKGTTIELKIPVIKRNV